MSSKKMFINNLRFNFILITLIVLIAKTSCQVSYDQPMDGNCTVNLQCNSGCCQSGYCTDNTKCKEFTDNVYKYQAIICAALVALFTLYLTTNLITLKKDFYKKIGREHEVKDKYCICF